MEFKIQKPCFENWEQMQENKVGRHCAVCAKSVHDLTKMTRTEMLLFLLENSFKQICARMPEKDIQVTSTDLPFLMEAFQKVNVNRSFLLLSLVAMSLASCQDETTERQTKTPQTHASTSVTDDEKKFALGKIVKQPNEKDSTSKKQTKQKKMREIPPVVIEPDPDPGYIPEPYYLGEPVAPPMPEPVAQKSNVPEVHVIVDVMPEFPGGMAAMQEFIKKNIVYPVTEKEMGLEGKVYLRFTVNEDGTLSDIQELRGINGAPGLTKEAIRVIKQMPKWSPGMNNNQKVKTQLNIPVVFRLD